MCNPASIFLLSHTFLLNLFSFFEVGQPIILWKNCGFKFFFKKLKKIADEIKNRTVYVLCRTDKPEDGTDLYIGSTSRPLKERLWDHKKKARKFKMLGYRENNKLFTRLNDVGLSNWKIIPLVTFACDQKSIFEFEQDWIKILKTDLNTFFPVTDWKEYDAEYRKNNKDIIRKYYIANRDSILRQCTEYRKNNIETNKYHCGVCDKSFGYKKDLDKHLGTLKHSYAYMDSVD